MASARKSVLQRAGSVAAHNAAANPKLIANAVVIPATSRLFWSNGQFIFDCGGKRSATPLWKEMFCVARKRRRRCALPAHSKSFASLVCFYLLGSSQENLVQLLRGGFQLAQQCVPIRVQCRRVCPKSRIF